MTQAVNSIGFGRFQIILSFIVGLCWMADSMEMMILSLLPLALHCEWGINQYRQAFLTTVVFIGQFKLLNSKNHIDTFRTGVLPRNDGELNLLGEAV